MGTVLNAVLSGGVCFTTNYSRSEAMRPFFLDVQKMFVLLLYNDLSSFFLSSFLLSLVTEAAACL